MKRGIGKTAKDRTPSKSEVKSISGSGSKRGGRAGKNGSARDDDEEEEDGEEEEDDGEEEAEEEAKTKV